MPFLQQLLDKRRNVIVFATFVLVLPFLLRDCDSRMTSHACIILIRNTCIESSVSFIATE